MNTSSKEIGQPEQQPDNEQTADNISVSPDDGNTNVGRSLVMGRKYFITQEQFEDIQHYKRMFEVNSENVQGLCAAEHDDIVYGFELGKMYSHLRECFVAMMNLESDIRNQKIEVDP